MVHTNFPDGVNLFPGTSCMFECGPSVEETTILNILLEYYYDATDQDSKDNQKRYNISGGLDLLHIKD